VIAPPLEICVVACGADDGIMGAGGIGTGSWLPKYSLGRLHNIALTIILIWPPIPKN